jgi:predicted amidohydrolase YtcJ
MQPDSNDRYSNPTLRVVSSLALVSMLVGSVLIVRVGRDTKPPQAARPTAAESSEDEAVSIPISCQHLLDDGPPSTPPADQLVLTNATVLTMDPQRRRAHSVATRDGQIAGIDSESSEGSVIDLEGATVLPGFIDSHSHWIGDSDVVEQTSEEAIDTALRWGWTSISELFVSWERLDALCELERSAALRVKVGAFLPLNYQTQRFGHWYDSYTPGEVFGPHLWIQGLKFFADGAPDGLGYQTKPPSPDVQGALFWDKDELAAEFVRANDAGWQIAIHATGDGGLDLALDAFEAVGTDDILNARDRVEHLTTVRDDQIDRLKKLGLIGSIQLSFFHAGVADELKRWLGESRVDLSGRWRDLIDAGIPIAGSTDRPWALAGISGPSIPAISQAVTRTSPQGKTAPPWMLSQLMTVDEALRSLTIDAAIAQRTEDSVGSIEVGKDADLAILSKDPTSIPPDELADIEIIATIVDGRVEYCGKSVPTALQEICP